MMNADPEHCPSFLQDSGSHGVAAAMLGRRSGCTDQVIGDILSGWRYDLSSVAPATHGDYEQHFVECFHCRARRRLHRTIDLVLMALFTLSFFAFLLATAVIHRAPWGQTSLASLHTRHLNFALTLQTAAMAGPPVLPAHVGLWWPSPHPLPRSSKPPSSSADGQPAGNGSSPASNHSA